ncbi:MAG: ABC transporter permease subunit [Anaerolineae bacterium]|nr:ABC transporter permease subunit [Anaerolineae bacterium]
MDGLPSFFLGMLLILASAVHLRWLPLSGARTPFAADAGLLVTGSVFVETLFAYPGLGHLLVTAVGVRGYPLIEGLFLVVSLAMVLANAGADVLSRWLDPRVGAA